MCLTEDFFTINVQIKKQEHKLLWETSASETNQIVQGCAVLRMVALNAVTAWC